MNIEKWLNELLSDETVNEFYVHDQVNNHWLEFVRSDKSSLRSLLYRHYLLKEYCNYPVSNRVDNSLLKKVFQFVLLAEKDFYYLPNSEVWKRVDHNYPILGQLQKLQSTIKDECDILADGINTIDLQVRKDHASLTSHSLLYCLYLICTVLEFEVKVRPSESKLALHSDIVHTLTTLKGVLIP